MYYDWMYHDSNTSFIQRHLHHEVLCVAKTWNPSASLSQNQPLDLELQMCVLLFLSLHDILLQKRVVPQREQVDKKKKKFILKWLTHTPISLNLNIRNQIFFELRMTRRVHRGFMEIRTLSEPSLAWVHYFQSFALLKLQFWVELRKRQPENFQPTAFKAVFINLLPSWGQWNKF